VIRQAFEVFFTLVSLLTKAEFQIAPKASRGNQMVAAASIDVGHPSLLGIRQFSPPLY
jgi:hypothetical protein